MNMEVLMQYITYALIAIGVLAFLTSIITQVIKEMPGLKNIQTNAVALVIALILCPLAKRCSTCDCADPVPVGCGDFVYLFAYSDSVVLHCRSGDCCLYCVSGRYGRMGKGIRDVEPNEI